MRKNKIITLMLSAALLLSVLTACGNKQSAAPPQTTAPAAAAEPAPSVTPEPEAGSPSDTGARTIVDLQGNEIELEGDVNTIATGKLNLTQLTLILSGPDAVATLGQGADCSEGTLMHDMFPELHGMDVFTESDMNIESLLNIAPDLVMIYGSTPSNDLSVQLQDSGLTVAICGLNNEEELLQTMSLMADALGEDAREKADAYEQFYRGLMADVQSKSVDISEEDMPRVAYMRSNGAVCSVNSMPNNWITAAGGRNIGAEAGLTAYAEEMTAEELLNYNPEIIFCESSMTLDFLSADEYKTLAAVENGALYVVPFGLSCSGLANAENPLVWQWAANIIQPEVYDYDAEQTVRDFFRQFYGYELSDEQLENVMNPAGQ